jgi:hypothetical protein
MINPSKFFHGCFSRFAGDALNQADLHSGEWTLVRRKKGRYQEKILKSNHHETDMAKLKHDEVLFAVTPKSSVTHQDEIKKHGE